MPLNYLMLFKHRVSHRRLHANMLMEYYVISLLALVYLCTFHVVCWQIFYWLSALFALCNAVVYLWTPHCPVYSLLSID